MHSRPLELKGVLEAEESILLNAYMEDKSVNREDCYLSLFSQDINELSTKKAILRGNGGIMLCIGGSGSETMLQAVTSICELVHDNDEDDNSSCWSTLQVIYINYLSRNNRVSHFYKFLITN